MSDYTSSEDFSSSGDEYNNSHYVDFTGDIINNYNVIKMIGKGSYSTIWLVFSVNDMKYYALKVQDPEEIKDGLEEIKILNKIPRDTPYINCLKDKFVENRVDEDGITINYLCSVYELCCGNLDNLARKGKYNKGYPLQLVKIMFKQILESVRTVHHKMDGFHGDIKPDNVLLEGINDKDMKYIELYNSANFNSIYSRTKTEYMKEKNLNKLSTEQKMRIRKKIHKTIIDNLPEIDIDGNHCDSKYFANPKIRLTDFGFYCHKDEKFNETFGTRYYMAPEIILLGECSEKVDIWALGCTLYELCTGEILFDPHASKSGSTDFHHLEMIINLCGEFKPNDIVKSKYYKKFFKKDKLINIIYEDDFKESTFNKIHRKLLNRSVNDTVLASIISSMLNNTPSKRPSINDLLNISWFN
jgi:serine/threonine protein kinase